MSSVGSFGTFTTARLAIYVANKGLSVTGNNIANINTTGYTRQRLDQASFKTGTTDRYQSQFDKHVGNGAIPQSVSQLRDPYLDIRYRAEHSSEGFYGGKLEGLQDIQAFLDETGLGDKDGDGLLYAEFSNFFDSLKHIEVGAGTEVNDTLALNSADALCALFQSAADQLQRLKENTETQMRQEVNDINDILVSIRGLNESIRQAEIYGDNALELRDQRNLLIDELSEKVKIDVTYSMEDIGLGKDVEKLTIRMGNANPDDKVNSDSSILVDGNYCAQLTTPLVNEKYVPLYDTTSEAYKKAVEQLKANEATVTPPATPVNIDVEDGLGNKVQFATVADLDKAIEDMLRDPKQATVPFQYLDENGLGTNDPREAAQVFDDHYNITISDLRDKNYKEWEDYGDPKVTTPTNQEDFPTRAHLDPAHSEFSFSGVWKDTDVIKVNDMQVVIGSAPTPPAEKTVYLSADEANADPKNVSNAIRDALVRSGAFDGYSITTKTTPKDGGYNVTLTVKAKEAGVKADPGATPPVTLPTIDISATPTANPTPVVSFDPMPPTQATDKDNKPITGQYKTEVKVDPPFHKNDTITIGTGKDAITLIVGKDIGVSAANDPKQLAARLAAKMKMDDYTVSSTTDADGKGYLVFKAKKDVTGGPAATDLPTVTPKAADPATFTGLTGNVLDGTIPREDPANPNSDPKVNLNPDPEVEDNGDNTTSTYNTRYYIDGNDVWHKVVTEVRTSKTTQLDDNDFFGRLQAVREQLTEEGEFASAADIALDENAAIKRGIPYYQNTLDLLARQFAKVMNDANNGYAVDEKGNYLDKNGEILTDKTTGDPINKIEGFTPAQSEEALKNFIDKYDVDKVNDQGNLIDSTGKEILLDGKPVSVTSLTAEELGAPDTVEKYLAGATIDEDGFVRNVNNDIIKTADGKELKISGFTEAQTKQVEDDYLESLGGDKMGGNLFSNRGDNDDPEGITAANISVAKSWSEGAVHVVPTYTKLFGGEVSSTTQQDNALHMSHLLEADLLYNPQDLIGDAESTHLFSGSFQDVFVKINTTLGNDMRSTEITLETHTGRALDIDTSRDSVSAVDLNDEAMDLMQYTHSLNAAYRLMTTLDEMLERLITGTGVTR